MKAALARPVSNASANPLFWPLRPGFPSSVAPLNMVTATSAMHAFKDEELGGLRRDMLRFAVLQLRDRALAEDVVHEALTSAVAAHDRFGQRATLRTWVFAILKNKLIDVMRDKWSTNRVRQPYEDSDENEFDGLFQADGQWNGEDRPSDWGNPEKHLENQEFWEVLQVCLDNLPEATARVFTMREVLGMEVGEICKELQITPSNCWVVLHRGRMGLRLCLQKRWFDGEER